MTTTTPPRQRPADGPGRKPGRPIRVLTALIALAALSPPPAQAQQQQWAAAYVNWSLEGAAPGEAAAQDLWIPQPATASFFTLNFNFVTGQGGYIGLQSDRSGVGNVRFSLWDTTIARGEACRPFDGEGEGMTCVLPVTIDPDGVYRVRVTREEADAHGQWWSGWLDEPNGASRRIGAIRTPGRHAQIAPDLHNFSEYWGDAVAACRDAPLSAAVFAAPQLIRADGGYAAPSQPTGTLPAENRCLTGGEPRGAAAAHTPLHVQGAPAMMITLGGAPDANRALAQELSRQAP